MITLRYFASLREALGTGQEHIELPDGISDLDGLTRWLQQRDETWRQALANHRLHVAVNQEVVSTNTALRDGDEIAWFPPVTGG